MHSRADPHGDEDADCAGALRHAVDLLKCLAAPDEDCRMVFSALPPEGSGWDCFGYISKHNVDRASSQFRPVLEQARAVLLLGGTMQLFQYLTSSLCS